jgi:hypothetical protein
LALATEHHRSISLLAGILERFHNIILRLGRKKASDRVNADLGRKLSTFGSPHSVKHKEANAPFGSDGRAAIFVHGTLKSNVAHCGMDERFIAHGADTFALIFARLVLCLHSTAIRLSHGIHSVIERQRS